MISWSVVWSFVSVVVWMLGSVSAVWACSVVAGAKVLSGRNRQTAVMMMAAASSADRAILQ